jgi:hypothetical protein
MIIYVAHPYTPDVEDKHEAARLAHKNVQESIQVSLKLIKLGHYPYNPLLTHYLHLEQDGTIPKEFWYRYDFVFLDYCDALLYLGQSNGTDRELEYAKKIGLAIFYAVDEIPRLS